MSMSTFPDAPWTTESGYDRYRNAFYGLLETPLHDWPEDEDDEDDWGEPPADEEEEEDDD